MDPVVDDGIAIFAGLNVVPKRSYLAACSSRVSHETNLRLLDTWFDEAQKAGLMRDSSIDPDFHTVPANTGEKCGLAPGG